MTMLATLHRCDVHLTQMISKRSLPSPVEMLICWPGAILFGWKGMLFLWPLVFFSIGGINTLKYFLVSAAISQSVCRLIKLTALRDRPTPPLPRPLRHWKVSVPKKGASGDSPSFPSGDAAAAGAAAGSLYFFFQGTNRLTLLLAVWAMIGRMFYHCHYFLDTLIGAGIGLISAVVVSRMNYTLSNSEILIVIPIFVLWMKIVSFIASLIRSFLGFQTDSESKMEKR
jgi:membrane-associated phospholipid phosphatase